jgi:hypothetical protein
MTAKDGLAELLELAGGAPQPEAEAEAERPAPAPEPGRSA